MRRLRESFCHLAGDAKRACKCKNGSSPIARRKFDQWSKFETTRRVLLSALLPVLAIRPIEQQRVLGYSVEELRAPLKHFEAGMSWNNYGKRIDEMEHDFPISSFPMTTTLAKINALKNLRPMAQEELARKKQVGGPVNCEHLGTMHLLARAGGGILCRLTTRTPARLYG